MTSWVIYDDAFRINSSSRHERSIAGSENHFELLCQIVTMQNQQRQKLRFWHGADEWHKAGYTGKGVKVGVIDSGFLHFQDRQGEGKDLPANVTAKCFLERQLRQFQKDMPGDVKAVLRMELKYQRRF